MQSSHIQLGACTISISGDILTVHLEYNKNGMWIDALQVADLRSIVLKFYRTLAKTMTQALAYSTPRPWTQYNTRE